MLFSILIFFYNISLAYMKCVVIGNLQSTILSQTEAFCAAIQFAASNA